MLSQTSLSFGINWTARKSNLSDFEALAELAKHYKAENINVLRYKPSPIEVYEKECLGRNEFFQLAGKMKLVKGIKIKTDSAYSNLLIHINNARVNSNTCGCGAGKTFMAVSPDSSFKPCSHLSLTDKQPSVNEYWQNLPDLKLMRSITFASDTGTCGSCAFEKLCGGCRAVCEHIYNDISSGEKDCPLYFHK